MVWKINKSKIRGRLEMYSMGKKLRIRPRKISPKKRGRKATKRLRKAVNWKKRSKAIVNVERENQSEVWLQFDQRRFEEQKRLPKQISNRGTDEYLLFKGELREYQKMGLDWLNTLSSKRISCILADEMGLGKTVQTIAHLAHLAEKVGVWGPHLIVVPTTVLGNWMEEFNRFLPSFKIFGYFGRSSQRKQKRKGWSDLDKFNVCLTTYRIVTIDSKVFTRRKWYSLILDEAHLIKNSKTQCFMALSKLKTINRIMLTGTPLQNKLEELWTLLTFLFPQKFGNKHLLAHSFDSYVEKAAKTNKSMYLAVIRKLHSIIRPLILRRLKSEVETQLPKKTEKVLKCQLSRRQKYLYDQFISNVAEEKKKRLGFVQSLNCLMQLRKICSHPDLIDDNFAESPFVCDSLEWGLPDLFLLPDSLVPTREYLEPFRPELHFSEIYSKKVTKEHLLAFLVFAHASKSPKGISCQKKSGLKAFWNMKREAHRRAKGVFPLSDLLIQSVKIFRIKLIGRTFDSRLVEAEIIFEKFIIKTEKVLGRGANPGHIFQRKRLLTKVGERMADFLHKQYLVRRPLLRNRLKSFEEM